MNNFIISLTIHKDNFTYTEKKNRYLINLVNDILNLD